ncbi:MAG: hypothetical protein J6I55_09305 [Ruminococcus sp.]|jgi:hypothetical protein|nr:hypothetical protein [Ruminococcus sp.]
MARNKYALCCALRHIYFNDFGLEKTFIMSDLLAVTSYYSDQNTPPEITENYKKLHMWLTKVEMFKKFQHEPSDVMIENIMQELQLIDINSMLRYVKEKATEAGDLSMQHVKGDNTKW